MIISGNTTGYRSILRQAPAPYMDPLRFSFSLDIAGLGENVEFGLSTFDDIPIIKYTLKSGLVYDYSGRFAGTYQNGINNFNYNYYNNNSWQFINGRLISSQDYFEYSPPFDKFYLKNNSSSNIDLTLDIKGFEPPTLFSGLYTDNLRNLSGFFTQSGLPGHFGEEILYQVYDINVPSQYGAVDFFDTFGYGRINYTITGNFSPEDVIPVTFNTYWGQFTIDHVVSGSTVAAGGGNAETGISLSVYGEDNIAQVGESLDFYIDYFSSSSNPVKVELEVTGGKTTVGLSGTGVGFVNYQGFISQEGTVYSTGPITGSANLLAPENSAYNTGYSLISESIDISKTGEWQKNTPFIGINSYSFLRLPLTGIYEGPNPSLIGKFWFATGDIFVDKDYTLADAGLVNFSGVNLVGIPRLEYNENFLVSSSINGPSYAIVTGTDSFFPNTSGTGKILPDDYIQIGQGYVSITDETGLFGYGRGEVNNPSTLKRLQGTGRLYFAGNINNWVKYSDWESPDPIITPEISGGAIVKCFYETSRGIAIYEGKEIPIEEKSTAPYTNWGYGSGPTEIIINSSDCYLRRNFAIPHITGVDSVGNTKVIGYTGVITGYAEFPTQILSGPLFKESKDTSLTLLPGESNGIYSPSGAVYGRSCIFGEIYTTLGRLGYTQNVTPTFILKQSNFLGVVPPNLVTFINTDIEKMYMRDLYPTSPINSNKSSINFINKEFEVYIPTSYMLATGKVQPSSQISLFNFYDGLDENSFLYNYSNLNWISGDSYVRPSPEILSAGGQSRYLKVEYLGKDIESEVYATLRVISPATTGEIYITGGGSGIR